MSAAHGAIEELGMLVSTYEGRINVSDRIGASTYFEGSEVEKETAHARLLAAVQRWTVPGSSYRDRAARIEEQKATVGVRLLAMFGLAKGLLEDCQAGYTKRIEELVHADLFADFLEMAQELLDKGYKDPAAVLAGSVLEEHLRKLALAAGIPDAGEDGRARKADAINADLAKESVYNKLEQKSVTSWLDLRNKAAHGHYDEYDHRQVAALIQSVRDFMVRHPA